MWLTQLIAISYLLTKAGGDRSLKMLLTQFIATTNLLVSAGRWAELNEFFSLLREIISRPTVQATVGKPVDKPKE